MGGIRHKHTAGLAIAREVFGGLLCGAFVTTMALLELSIISIVVVSLTATLLSVAVTFALKSESSSNEIAFGDVPPANVAALQPGSLARVRVVLAGPGALKAPLQAVSCSYYCAHALFVGDVPDAGHARLETRWDGVLASASDATGALELDFTRDVRLMNPEFMPCAEYERSFRDDPLALDTWAEYRPAIHVLEPGDELEAVGRVERDEAGTLKLVPEGEGGLRVRWLARAAR